MAMMTGTSWAQREPIRFAMSPINQTKTKVRETASAEPYL